MRRLGRLLAAVCLGVLVVGTSSQATFAQEKADGKGSKELTADERRELDESHRLNEQGAELYQQARYEEAIKLVEKSLEISKRVLGKEHPEYATSLNNLGVFYKSIGDYARAEPLYKQALEIRRKDLGETHPDYAQSLNNLAVLYHSMGDYARAERLFKQALEIRRKVLGEAHPDYALSLNNLAFLYASMGDYVRAEPLYEQALRIRRKVLGEAHPDYALSLNNLAALYALTGHHARAEPLYKQALEIRGKAVGKAHPDYAQSLNNLAFLYASMGDYARAEPLYKQALEITRKVPGETHPDYATSLNNLAGLYDSMGDYARAEPLYKQALEITRRALGEAHPDYATNLNNLALLYQSMGDYARAEPLYKRALEINRNVGEAHPDYATRVHNLALLYQSMGDYARAEPLFKQSLQITEYVLGKAHPDYASSLNSLAALYYSMADYARAEPYARRAVEIVRRNLELTSVVQSERQQLSMNERLRFYLDLCLTVTPAATSSPDAAYDEVLAWKGAVSARQQLVTQSRRTAGANEPGVARLYGDLENASRQFATLSRLTPSPEDAPPYRDRLAKLSERIEQLERQLSHASADFRAHLAQRRRTGGEVAAALPEGTALVDLLEYWHYEPPEKHPGKGTSQQRCAAFILRRDRPIARVDLGAAEPIRLAVLAWRRQSVPSAGEHKSVKDSDRLPTNAREVLQHLVWDKLAPHLDGTSTLLVSPDGALDRFPWAAMPVGERQYLIEKMAVAIVPVPRMLPEMIAGGEPTADGAPSLLLVGDVDYGASAGAPVESAQARSAPRERNGKLLQDWQELNNTRQEALAVGDSFKRRFPESTVTFLRRGEPTEEHVRQAAPTDRYLHLATHGYFAPPQLRSALSETQLQRAGLAQELVTRQDVAGFHPGLLSGIVLAGANRPLDPDEDDGILTALEVAKLDLRGVDLVTLSACETGLGETAGGEGLLGLQRAFQSAGAKSVVASLWQVHDAATRQFMIDFYETLWQRQVPTAEALRQAQLTMLRGGPERSRGTQGRGLKLLDDQPPDKQGRLPPYYWAAFVLSGDWR